jgi:hypothetical protein
MTMTTKESDRVADLVEELAVLAATKLRTPDGHPQRGQLDDLIQQKKTELSAALRVS